MAGSPPPSSPRGHEATDAFLDHLAVERGLSQHTLDAYAGDLGRLQAFLDERSHTMLSVARDDLTDFVQREAAAGRAASSRARAVAAVRSFFQFLAAEGWRSDDPSDVLVTPKREKRLPHSIPHEQLAAMLEAPPTNSVVGVRDRAILELLYASGLRASEVVGLTLDDLSLTSSRLRCRGKGSKERVAPLGDEAVRRLESYLERARPRLDRRGQGAGRVFLSRRGTPLSRQSLWRLVRARGREAGLARDAYPHLFRHTFATHMVEEGANLRVVQELLGHANVTTTEVYTHVDRSRLKGIHARFHPRG